MKCNHCGVEYHEILQHSIGHRNPTTEFDYVLESSLCPACKNSNIFLIEGNAKIIDSKFSGRRVSVSNETWKKLVYPFVGAYQQLPPEVPKNFRDLYTEAMSILRLSPRASAALGRRLLEAILISQGAPKGKDLFKQIEWCIESGIPSYLASTIDDIRKIGKFAAHIKQNVHTGEVLEVDSGEAEYVLNCIANLCDFYFVYPAKVSQRSAAIRDKLGTTKSVDRSTDDI